MGHTVRATIAARMAAMLLLFTGLTPLSAQESGAARGRSSKTPPPATLPAGWSARLDPQEIKAGRTLGSIKVEGDSVTLHVTGGAAATLWNPAHTATGSYTVWGSFTHLRGSTPPGSFGPFIGGSSLDGKEYNYLYCAVFANGSFSVKHRFGGELHSLIERKASGAIRQADASGKASNAISWVVDATNVACHINGTAVATFPRALVIGPGKLESTDGVYGLHVDQDVEARIAEFGLSRR